MVIENLAEGDKVKMKKVRIGGLIALLVMVAIIIYIKMLPVNTSFIGLVGGDWKSVTLYYYGDEMTLNDEEIQKVYDVFSDMEVKCTGFVSGESGFIDIIYVNGKDIIVKGSTVVLGILEYQVIGNPDYTEQLKQLEEEFAAARGIPLKN